MAFKDREENKAYCRKYRLEHKEENKSYQRKYQEKQRRKALKLLGGKCFICGKVKKLSFHKKDGESHDSQTVSLVLKNPEKFVLLCVNPCHRGVHWLMKVFNMDWGEIGDFIKIFEK